MFNGTLALLAWTQQRRKERDSTWVTALLFYLSSENGKSSKQDKGEGAGEGQWAQAAGNETLWLLSSPVSTTEWCGGGGHWCSVEAESQGEELIRSSVEWACNGCSEEGGIFAGSANHLLIKSEKSWLKKAEGCGPQSDVICWGFLKTCVATTLSPGNNPRSLLAMHSLPTWGARCVMKTEIFFSI